MVFEDHGISFQSTDPIIIQLCIGKKISTFNCFVLKSIDKGSNYKHTQGTEQDMK